MNLLCRLSVAIGTTVFQSPLRSVWLAPWFTVTGAFTVTSVKVTRGCWSTSEPVANWLCFIPTPFIPAHDICYAYLDNSQAFRRKLDKYEFRVCVMQIWTADAYMSKSLCRSWEALWHKGFGEALSIFGQDAISVYADMHHS